MMSSLPPSSPSPDARWMRQALRLAARGRGFAEPNPMVGCVIVKSPDDKVPLGQGFHEQFGGPHAEANALRSCSESTIGATVYVTLEPCSHRKKKTPPCVPRLIEARVSRVFVACTDPNPFVSGAGITALRTAGIDVINEGADLLTASCQQLNAAYFARLTRGVPYVTLKWAQTRDGAVAGPGGSPLQITSQAARHAVHALRGRCDAIAVGIETILADDPLLTVRDAPAARRPMRVIFDSHLRLPLSSRLLQVRDEQPIIDFCTVESANALRSVMANLNGAGVTVVPVPSDGAGRVALEECLIELGNRQVTHLLVEPGPTLARAFIDSGTVDRVWLLQSPDASPGAGCPIAVRVPYPAVARTKLGADDLVEFLNPASLDFYIAEPSADFQLLSDPGKS